MADKGNTSSHTGRQKNKIKKNERKINDLEEEVGTLREKLKDHEENCEPKIKELEKEIERLKEENRTLQKEIGDLKQSNAFLENDVKSIKQINGDLEKQLKEHDKELKMLKFSGEDVLVIRQLCSSVQQKILKFVLQNNFDEIQNKSTKYIELYIKKQIKDKQEQERAKSRWENLKREINWDGFLIIQLKSVKVNGNAAAHPSLTEEKIDDAKTNLEEKKELSRNMVEAVEQLKDIWKQMDRKLLHGSRESSAEVQDLNGLKYPPTHASKAAEYTLAVWMPRYRAFDPKYE